MQGNIRSSEKAAATDKLSSRTFRLLHFLQKFTAFRLARLLPPSDGARRCREIKFSIPQRELVRIHLSEPLRFSANPKTAVC
jgi:hypothetical protein